MEQIDIGSFNFFSAPYIGAQDVSDFEKHRPCNGSNRSGLKVILFAINFIP
ncbi:hypothetical protein I5677_00425 [Mobilitalea sibirica]|uniref:Uncharacterized protein n=1 Tax=Mobilitalea sibirica TaxID=1462919 RepID=A0A8J7KRJ3_9FIRM|nr:hypothetical protein [Mobilitalea sibirica]